MARSQFTEKEKEENIAYIFDHFIAAQAEGLTDLYNLLALEFFYELWICPKRNIPTLSVLDENLKYPLKEFFFDSKANPFEPFESQISNHIFSRFEL